MRRQKRWRRLTRVRAPSDVFWSSSFRASGWLNGWTRRSTPTNALNAPDTCRGGSLCPPDPTDIMSEFPESGMIIVHETTFS